MPVDRAKWITPFRWGQQPAWPCPSCADGHLKGREDAAPVAGETAWSKRAQGHPAWDVEDFRGRFVALLTCTVCSDVVALSGATALRYEQAEDDPYNVETYYAPLFFSPAPALFRISVKCIPEVRKELERAWTLFWVDRAACANRIRSCVELILTGERVKRYGTDKKGARTRLSLHDRIESYRKREPGLADEMMAVKWLGNAGSHGAHELTIDGVFDGFDLLEHVLEEVYGARTKTLARIRRDLIRRRGRPRTRGQGS
jgi:hypothetical protein